MRKLWRAAHNIEGIKYAKVLPVPVGACISNNSRCPSVKAT